MNTLPHLVQTLLIAGLLGVVVPRMGWLFLAASALLAMFWRV